MNCLLVTLLCFKFGESVIVSLDRDHKISQHTDSVSSVLIALLRYNKNISSSGDANIVLLIFVLTDCDF